MGLGEQFGQVKKKYSEANELLGNIIKGRVPRTLIPSKMTVHVRPDSVEP